MLIDSISDLEEQISELSDLAEYCSVEAHEREDEIMRAVLWRIASSKRIEDAQELAKLAVSTEDIVFNRWCS